MFSNCHGSDVYKRQMYNFVKERGYAIYPGKLTKVDTFRMGNIGEIYKEDVENLYNIFYDYLKQNA